MYTSFHKKPISARDKGNRLARSGVGCGWLNWLALAVVLALVSGCGGTRIREEPVPLQIQKPLISTGDEHLHVDLDWIIVRDGPGSWAKAADWDEYLVAVQNVGDEPLEVAAVAVYDSSGYRLDTDDNRKKLQHGSQKTVRRYRDLGIAVEAGWGSAGNTILLGSAVTVGGVVTVVESMWTGSAAAVNAGAAAGLLIGPAIVTLGVVQVLRNKKVAREIKHRQTRLPVLLAPQEAAVMDLFFPLAPSPRFMALDYRTGGKALRLDVDTRMALSGLHIQQEQPAE